MGCDGGTIPRREELVPVKKKPETKDKSAHRIFQWRYCNITQLLLKRPIVTCGLGNLYNKTSVIEALIDKTPLPTHIKSLKDTKEINLTPNPNIKEDEISLDEGSSPYICPISGLEMAGKFKFVALWSCGCVFAERALKELSGGKVCPKCQTNYQDSDVVILNPDGHDLETMIEHLRDRKKRKRVKLN